MVKELLVTAAAVAIGVIVATLIQKKFLSGSSWEESYEE